MNYFARTCLAAFLSMISMGVAHHAQAQSYGECPSTDLTCQTKYALYDAYLTQMGMGVTMHSLPALYQDVLAAHFPNADLGDVRFGFSNRQPPATATCDCDKIYFNDAAQVEKMRTGTLDTSSEMGWMLHELGHYEQCREIGSREAFARMWWEHLSATELQTLISTNAWNEVHDGMAMEQDADARAGDAMASLRDCCIQPSTGRIVRPIQVTPMTFSSTTQILNHGLTVDVQASDGAEPYMFEWSRRLPSNSFFQPLSATLVSPGHSRVVLALSQAGTHVLRLRVLQDDGSMTMHVHEEERSFIVHGPEVLALNLGAFEVDGGAAVQATANLHFLPPSESVEVALSSSDPAAVVPGTLNVTASANGTAVLAFEIATGVVPSTRTATIEARIGDSARTSNLTINGAQPGMVSRFDRIEVDRPDLRPDEAFRARLILDGPASGPLDIILESSHPEAVAVPRSVRFEKGEREKSISLRTSRKIDRQRSVTIRARAASDRTKIVETKLEVRPTDSPSRSEPSRAKPDRRER